MSILQVSSRARGREELRKLVLSAMLLALGLVLPFLTGQIPQFGKMLLPMHVPVLLCGLVCGWAYGGVVGAILPLLRSFLFIMPSFYPTAIAMSVELCVYGLTVGLFYGLFKKTSPLMVYGAMLPAMLLGRLAWGVAQTLLLSFQDISFSLQAFWAGAFVEALPGILLQLVLIPITMTTLHYTGLQRFRKAPREEEAS